VLVEHYATLFHIAQILLSEDDDQRTPEVLFRRVLEATGAERGFIVVREGASFEQRFDVCFDREALSSHERRWSRTLVRRAITTRAVLDSPDLTTDPRFAEQESIQGLRARAVLVAPLTSGDEVYGVVYLERGGAGAFTEDARRFVAEFTGIAGLFLRRAAEREALRQRTHSLERDLFAQHDFTGIVTRSPRLLELLRTVAQIADSHATVLVRGETGTGKELVARALHVNSGRRHRPFVTLHTTALPSSVLESELFGHKRGAFTGADRDRVGRIASADGGTLFLDEVAEITPEVQVKLLRFLQFGEIQPLGSDRAQKVDVRVLAATHQDLAALIESGRFRQDLYFRLKVIELEIPPLRDRRGDIPLLVEHFTRRLWRRAGEEPRWSPRAEQALAGYAWPGNVRELEHAVERACLLARGPDLDLDALPAEIGAAAIPPAALPPGAFVAFTHAELEAAKAAAAIALEDEFLAGLMPRCEGNVSLAARHSGIHRSQLQKLLARRRGP
jgi:Nif-specific regulatory protein/two-component system response regulator HydG